MQVDICLATFNGSRFLEEFWQSLVAQSESDWRLLVRDDGSSDGTPEMLLEIARGDQRISGVYDDGGRLGVIGNFSRLLSRSSAQYVMLADQDDVWHPDKIARSIAAISELEMRRRRPEDAELPCLAFSDLRVVDSKRNVIADSFFAMQRLDADVGMILPRLLTQNVAPGCSMIMNRALLDAALPVPSVAAMHDWWLLLVACALGATARIEGTTIDYRQHGGNEVGAQQLSTGTVLRQLKSYRQRLHAAQRQAGALEKRFGERLSIADRSAALAFSRLPSQIFGERQLTAWRHGLKKQGVLRNLAFMMLM